MLVSPKIRAAHMALMTAASKASTKPPLPWSKIEYHDLCYAIDTVYAPHKSEDAFHKRLETQWTLGRMVARERKAIGWTVDWEGIDV